MFLGWVYVRTKMFAEVVAEFKKADDLQEEKHFIECGSRMFMAFPAKLAKAGRYSTACLSPA
ncbi:MAG: hypothetical protein DMG39_29945 [Acidobacteria bacterium]|nr:MAG: hypothetical protein DMG39_29945 [Acidobacteriota bacterium]